jgi:hypothetical protein
MKAWEEYRDSGKFSRTQETAGQVSTNTPVWNPVPDVVINNT